MKIICAVFLLSTFTLLGCYQTIPAPPELNLIDYNIIEINMPSVPQLWPDYTSGNGYPTYSGRDELNNAFKACTTKVNVKEQYGVDDGTWYEGYFTDSDDLHWYIVTDGEVITQDSASHLPNGGMNYNCAYIAAIGDLDPALSLNDPRAIGMTIMRSNPSVLPTLFSQQSAFCYVFGARVQNLISTEDYYIASYCTAAGIHELGHGRGINHDDPIETPGHGGTGAGTCVMHNFYLPTISAPPPNYMDPNDPRFCQSHAAYIYSQTW
jgi:hypothetical protein